MEKARAFQKVPQWAREGSDDQPFLLGARGLGDGAEGPLKRQGTNTQETAGAGDHTAVFHRL